MEMEETRRGGSADSELFLVREEDLRCKKDRGLAGFVRRWERDGFKLTLPLGSRGLSRRYVDPFVLTDDVRRGGKNPTG